MATAHSRHTPWQSQQVAIVHGLADKRIETGEEFETRPLVSFWDHKPTAKPKHRGLAFIPSTYREHDAREHKRQQSAGRFVALVGDVDHGNCSLEQIEGLVRHIVGAGAYLIHSTANAVAGDLRWRIILPLHDVLSFADWRDAQEACFDIARARGIAMDGVTVRAGQISFLPNVPLTNEKTGDALRGDDGHPLFYAASSSSKDALGLRIDQGPTAEAIAALRRRRAEDERLREQMRAEAERRRANRPQSNDGSVIDAFNSSNSIADMLAHYRYEQSKRDTRDWKSPQQTSGSFATRILGEKWVSLSGSDAASGLGTRCDNGCFGDAYDLFVHYEHGGNRSAAWKAVCNEQGRPFMRAVSSRSADFMAGDPFDPGHTEMPDDPGDGDGEAFGAASPITSAGVFSEVEPVDLWARYQEPTLPAGLLPEVIERFAFRQGEIMGADPAGLAMAALTVCGAAIPDTIALQVKRNDPTWRESARLWTALVGPPSRKKTPIFKAALAPLRSLDNNLMRAYLDTKSTYDALTAAEKKEADRPRQKRLIISDTTIEAAQEVLRDSPDGLLSAQDELSGWFGSMDKYAPGKGAQADRAFWLQAFNGGTYNVNRVQRGAIHIPNLSISLLGGVQPEPIRKLAADTVDDGLVQRLLPVILRPSAVGKDMPGDSVVADYARLIERLNIMRPATRETFGQEDDRPMPVQFSSPAKALREELEVEHLGLVQALEAISPKLASHFGKYDGLFARLCLLWHCIDNADAAMPPREISQDTAQRVSKFMAEFIRPSAVAFYAGLLGMSAGHEDIVGLASLIVAKGLEEVKARDAQRSTQSFRAITADQFRVLCEKLEAFGWLAQEPPGPKSNTPRWVVNPRVHVAFADRAEREAERRHSAKMALREALGG